MKTIYKVIGFLILFPFGIAVLGIFVLACKIDHER
jgi:hypothetical protein